MEGNSPCLHNHAREAISGIHSQIHRDTPTDASEKRGISYEDLGKSSSRCEEECRTEFVACIRQDEDRLKVSRVVDIPNFFLSLF